MIAPPEESTLVVLPLPDIFDDPTAFHAITLPEFAGSIALDEDASVGLLYTTAVASDRLTIVEMEGAIADWTLRTVLVKAPIQAVFPAPDGEHAIVFMGQAAGSSMPGGYSVVPLGAMATVSDDAGINEVHVLRMPELSSDVIKLPSVPLAAGIVPETATSFVAQYHAEGRITFVGLEGGEPRTLTGFELAEKVHDGSE